MSEVDASFDRIVNLKVFQTQDVVNADGSPGLSQPDQTGTLFPSRFPDGTMGFRVRFRVDKVAAVTSAIPNPVSIQIYNLGPDSRAKLERTNNLIVLEAGYGNSPRRIFKGNILWGKTEKHGADYITDIQAADGLFAFQNSRVNLAFNASIAHNQVINSLVSALGAAGIKTGQIQGVPSGGYNGGIVLSGKTVDLLKEVCDKHDLNFSIQDGEVLILPYGANRGTPARLISADTGMIGIPQKRAQDATGKGTIISLKELMDPELGVYQQILVKSRFVNGIFTTARVTHDGDSWEGPFFTEIEAA